MTYYLDPTREQFGAMMKLPDDGPIHMLNLIRFKDKASYEDGRDLTGEEAYQLYGRESGPIFSRVGGRIVWKAHQEFMLIGPDDKHWDLMFIAEYPSAAAFGEMVKDPDYQLAVKHRQAAVLDSRLIRTKPGEIGKTFSG